MTGLAPLPVHPRRLVFLGTPGPAVPFLDALVASGFDVALVVSRDDRRRGRAEAPTPSPVKAAAQRSGIPVTTQVADVVGAGADLGVVVAFGRLIPAEVLAQVPMVNVHFSLLPRWRGAAPVERALLAGDAETGVCLMQVVEALDAGGVLDCCRTPIMVEDTLATLRDRLVEQGTELLVSHLRSGLPLPRPQEGDPVYAAKIEQAELALDWTRPAEELARVVRLGGAWTTLGAKRLKVLAARAELGISPGSAVSPGSGTAGPGALVVGSGSLRVVTGEGELILEVVQPEGRRAQEADAWVRGVRLTGGERLGG